MRNITLRKFFLRSRYSMMLCQRKFASFEIWKPDDFIRYPGRIDDTIIRIATAIYLYIYIDNFEIAQFPKIRIFRPLESS